MVRSKSQFPKSVLFLAVFSTLTATACMQPVSSSTVKDSGTCSYPAWAAGSNYNAGDKVVFNGKPYVAENANPGYDPTVSTWFWDPTTCESGANAATKSSSCQGQAWQEGKTYAEGSIVIYNGKAYKAAHENPGYDPVISTWFWTVAECAVPETNSGNGGNQSPNQNPSQDPRQNPSQDPRQNPSQDPRQNPSQDVNERPNQEVTENPSEELNQNPNQDPNQNPTQDPRQNPSQDPNQNPAQNPKQTPAGR